MKKFITDAPGRTIQSLKYKVKSQTMITGFPISKRLWALKLIAETGTIRMTIKNQMNTNSVVLSVGGILIASITWLLVNVSALSGDVKLIKFQVGQNRNHLETLMANRKQ